MATCSDDLKDVAVEAEKRDLEVDATKDDPMKTTSEAPSASVSASAPSYFPEWATDAQNAAFFQPRQEVGLNYMDYMNFWQQQHQGGFYGLIPPPPHHGHGMIPPLLMQGPGSVLSRDSSRDDLTSMGDCGQMFDYEDRFRVDRRKLELLMLGRFEPLKGASAADFFGRVGDETNTTVIWPSRLKIGAKSKKDPHVRVGGFLEDNVRTAKARIMEYLDTRSNRVTMKMDVSYTDHSHVIGKGGNTIRR